MLSQAVNQSVSPFYLTQLPLGFTPTTGLGSQLRQSFVWKLKHNITPCKIIQKSEMQTTRLNCRCGQFVAVKPRFGLSLRWYGIFFCVAILFTNSVYWYLGIPGEDLSRFVVFCIVKSKHCWWIEEVWRGGTVGDKRWSHTHKHTHTHTHTHSMESICHTAVISVLPGSLCTHWTVFLILLLTDREPHHTLPHRWKAVPRFITVWSVRHRLHMDLNFTDKN